MLIYGTVEKPPEVLDLSCYSPSARTHKPNVNIAEPIILGVHMSDISSSIAKTEELRQSAEEVLKGGDFMQAERLFRAAINVLGTVMDPMHATYIELLDGLLICLEKQDKSKDAKDVSLLLSQLKETK